MKEKNYSFLTFIRKTVPLFLMLVFVNVGWGQTTVTYSYSQSGAAAGLNANPPIVVDANIGFASFKNNGTTNPTINNGQLRLYQNATKGGSIKVYATNGAVITEIVFFASGNDGKGPAKYAVDGEANGISVLNASGKYTISSINASDNVEFYNVGSSSSNRTYVDKFEVTYTMPSSGPTISVSTTAITDLDYIGNGPSDVKSFTVTGANLDGSGAVTATLDSGVSSDFEVGLTDNGVFTSNVTLPAYSGAPTEIFVRLKAGKIPNLYTGNLTASSTYNSDEFQVALSGKVTAPPSIPVVTAENLTGTFGQAFSHQVVASDTPDSYAISNGALPNGITLNTITGLISGTPTQAGTYTADITATNSSGTSAQAEFNFDIAKATQTLISFVDLNKYDTDVPFLLPEITNANLTLVYESSNLSVSTIVGDEVTITGIGATTISAVNAGDSNWNAFSKSITLTVTEAPELYNGVGVFKLVTSLADVTDGYYVITNEANTFVMTNGRSGTATGGYFLSGPITPVNTKITNPVSANVWKIETNGSGKTIYNEITGKYVGWSSGNAASIEDDPADSNRWIFTYSDDKFTVNNLATSARQLSFNSGSPRFAAYANAGQQELQLYKLSIPVTWNGTAWSNTTGPDATLDAVIAGDYSTTTDLTAKSLTVNSGVFTVTTGTTLTVANAIVNNAGATNFIVENDAVVLQGSNTLNTGAVTVKRNSADLYRQDYTLWSAPVTGQNLRAFSEQTIFSRFYSYSNAVAGPNNLGAYVQELFDNADIAAKNFNVAQGYLIRMPNDWPVYVDNATPGTPYAGAFQGTLNNGDYTVPLVMANTNMNLVGNPYPSPISVSAFLGANANIEGTLYFWRKRNGTAGTGYATSTGLGLVNPVAGSLGDLENLIKPGQGFFVKGLTAGNVVFNNTMRVNTAGGMFLKTASDTPAELHRFWLNLSNTTEVVGQTLVGYTTAATQAVDNGIDAAYFNDSALALTSLIDSNEFTIQGRSLPFTTTDIVPLGFKSDVAGTFTISLANFDGVFAGNQDIFLKDNTTGTYHNLKNNAYSFTTVVGVFNNRFQVEYNGALGTTNPTAAENAILIGVKNQQITINAGSTVMEKIELIDVSGRIIYTQGGVKATTAIIENLQVANQMLIVRISTANNTVVNQKIIF